MKKAFEKIKTGLVVFRLALISFPLKVKWLRWEDWEWAYPQSEYWIYNPEPVQVLYWVPSSVEPAETIVDTIIKIAPRLLIAITFIVWIVSFLKIRKIDNKAVKKKRIKKTIIIITILIILFVGILLLPLFLNKYW